jgi:hypothetical protein
MNDQTTNWQMVDLKPMSELDALWNRAETAEMDARLAGEEIERLNTQLAALTAERGKLRDALAEIRDAIYLQDAYTFYRQLQAIARAALAESEVG